MAQKRDMGHPDTPPTLRKRGEGWGTRHLYPAPGIPRENFRARLPVHGDFGHKRIGDGARFDFVRDSTPGDEQRAGQQNDGQ